MATQLPTELSESTTKQVGARVPLPLKEWYEREAIRRSEPGNIKRPSDLYREALARYANAHLADEETESVELTEEA